MQITLSDQDDTVLEITPYDRVQVAKQVVFPPRTNQQSRSLIVKLNQEENKLRYGGDEKARNHDFNLILEQAREIGAKIGPANQKKNRKKTRQ